MTDHIQHAGVKGMKWGVRKNGERADTAAQRIGLTNTGTKPLDKAGNLKRPSYGRELLLGTWANSKARYTDPKALERRTTAGKLFAAAALTQVASSTMKVVASKTNSQGAAMAANILGVGASGLTLGSLGYGISAAATERKARPAAN